MAKQMLNICNGGTLLNSRVANVFLRLCDETSLTPARLNAVLAGLGKMNPRWLRFGEHRGLRKRVLEHFRLKDTIAAIEPEFYCLDGRPKDSVDQGSALVMGLIPLAVENFSGEAPLALVEFSGWIPAR